MKSAKSKICSDQSYKVDTLILLDNKLHLNDNDCM